MKHKDVQCLNHQHFVEQPGPEIKYKNFSPSSLQNPTTNSMLHESFFALFCIEFL